MILSKNFVDSYKNKLPSWGPIGYIVYKRTYARPLDQGKEEWYQTVERCVNGILAIAPKGFFTDEDAMFLYDSVFNFKCCFSGRALWQLGTINVERFGGDSLQNCWFVSMNEPIEPFLFLFNELMLGGGVGYNITPQNVYSLPIIKNKVNITKVSTYDCSYIIPDNREGWTGLLFSVLNRAFSDDSSNLTYNTECIRPRGSLIKSFGGVASGAEELEKGINDIVTIINRRVNEKLRPIDVLDICNIIGRIVVSGNVRRSAELALGSVNDHEFLNAKDWVNNKIPSWRSMSNNSVAVNSFEELNYEFWDGFVSGGESYGIVNLRNCRHYGRIADGFDYKPDILVEGTNPCGEITLESYESCNLGEIFLPNIHNVDELHRVAKTMYGVCKVISTLPFLYKKTQEVVHRNHRLGLSLTGFMQCSYRYNIELFDNLYNDLEQYDNKISAYYGFNKSIKLTTVKPSGTVSLLAGVTPGVHPAFAPYYIRRVRLAENDPLVDICKAHGYSTEPEVGLDGKLNLNTIVVSFPIKSPEEAVCEKYISIIQQLENIKFLQSYWSDNSVSCTVYYSHENLPEVRDWLSENFDELKCMSFSLKQDHNYTQAPMEEISKEEYEKLMEDVTQIVSVEGDDLENLECSNGGCPIK